MFGIIIGKLLLAALSLVIRTTPLLVASDGVHAAADQRPVQIARMYARAGHGDAPLLAHTEEMVRAADYYGIDWRLIPAMGILESSGGLYACGGNAWGYGSCEEGYADWPDFSYGIWFVAKRLSQQPYTPADIEHSMCVWVSGHGCWGDHATGYRDRGLWLMGLLE